MPRTLWAAALFALSCNLDTLLLSLNCALRGCAPSPGAEAVLAAVTTLVTAAALGLGRLAAALTVLPRPGVLGGLTLMGLGLWTVLDALRRPGGAEEGAGPDGPSCPTARACVGLGCALAVNNAGAGVAAGLAGLTVVWGSAFSLVFTLLSLWAGRRLAGRLRNAPRLARLSLPLSGALLALLGAAGLFL